MTTKDIQIAANTDDVSLYWNPSNWIFDTALYNEAGYYSSSHFKSGCGMRFVGADILEKSVIDTAYLTFVSASTTAINTVKSKFTGCYSQVTFSTKANYQARRGVIAGGADDSLITAAQVSFDAIGSWVNGTSYQSPELKSIIQELVNSGDIDDVVLFWDDHDDRSTHTPNCFRRGHYYDAAPASSPILHLEYHPLARVWPGISLRLIELLR